VEAKQCLDSLSAQVQIVFDIKPVRLIYSLGYSNPCGHTKSELCELSIACYLQVFRVYKAQTVMFVLSNPESSAQPSGTIGRASNMLNRLDCSYQNCLTGPRDSVDAVYLVNAVDVCCSWPFEHRLIPFREPIVGMAGRIVSEVSFVFNNVAGSPSPTITNPQYLA